MVLYVLELLIRSYAHDTDGVKTVSPVLIHLNLLLSSGFRNTKLPLTRYQPGKVLTYVHLSFGNHQSRSHKRNCFSVLIREEVNRRGTDRMYVRVELARNRIVRLRIQ